jgi:hypothetical protein
LGGEAFKLIEQAIPLASEKIDCLISMYAAELLNNPSMSLPLRKRVVGIEGVSEQKTDIP